MMPTSCSTCVLALMGQLGNFCGTHHGQIELTRSLSCYRIVSAKLTKLSAIALSYDHAGEDLIIVCKNCILIFHG